ncbi:MFS transporter [Brevibacillus reuszeri]|uniref:Arabinose ABC transporter permease n=1 Tax=Brevibacillus reuszeri TaxID=54915 RepID=A0A0K9YXY0_9BACL|nr:MFS transporter [Brevibacillus reuszeri]KNB73512.1 arabinose ABC transporter permease [Brevibacillus reuszeri]MED1858696.1 MFS transporter [Brevibacillus reuszeri]GED69676.1 MFS transporter [Brevibacillus reuszeri]
MTTKNPLLILLLALGVFGIITTEMGIVGVLPQITQKFHVSTAEAGFLVSIFALVVAISGPFLTLLASSINRKVILLTAVLLFAISNLAYAYTTYFEIMLAFRILPALFHPVFFSVALVTAARLVPPEKSGQAVTQVFAGITVGFAFGVPLTSYLAETISLEAAFLFSAVVSLIAFVGILAWLPSMPVSEKMTYGKQLGILRNPRLWLQIASVVFIFAAMFSVYSYFAEYLGQVTQMSGSWISFMLMAFGVIMIAGNFLFGGMLQKSLTKTVAAYPLLYGAVYLIVYLAGPSFLWMTVVVFLWGIVHSGGLVVSQAWLMKEAKEAPEFGNSLFVSFSNLGITLGSYVGGWFISEWGVHQLIWSGVLFAGFAFLTIAAGIKGIGISGQADKQNAL